ncbi:MAG: carboxypeptidase M32 [Acholeplasmatales bacterium]|nr:MAG: carboxypeptidase M32 [Acholeplasmatales bacterium]
MQPWERFKAIQKKLKAYSLVLGIASWDSHTEAPKKCFPYRADMLSIISGESFALQTSPEYVGAVEALYAGQDTLSTQDREEVHQAKRALDKILKIPKEVYTEYVKLLNMSQRVWEDAKAKDDYDLFEPYLDQIIATQKKLVAYRSDTADPYDVLLDDFEAGMSMAKYDTFFNTVKGELVPFVKEVLAARPTEKPAFIDAFYARGEQKQFVEKLMEIFQYDTDRGLLKESVHPFTWNTHSQDVRFTVRYLENYVFSSIFAAIHELGHALYEMNIAEALDTTNLNTGTSMGIHESQSRFYENIIGRDKAFWSQHYQSLQAIFPKQLGKVSLDDFYLGINWVEESFIRVEADELTYPLHILIRYEMERAIFNEGVDVKSLPTLWNEKMKTYLNIEPKTAGEGILQDVHWSGGAFGYFPTYALGSAYAAQFFYTMKQDLDFTALLETGDLTPINNWLKDKIHQYGKIKSPEALILDVTGEPFDPQYYIRYLKEKYSALYLKG